MRLSWQDVEDIAIELYEKLPGIDPLSVRFTDLHRWVCELSGFEDDPNASTEGILEAIQMAWWEEWKEAQRGPWGGGRSPRAWQWREEERTMLADQFTQTFRDEHRKIRDVLLDLIQAFKERNGERIRTLLGQAAVYVGPHFRYEEEALYPALVDIFGEEYIEQLLGDHDRAIGTAQRLIELSEKDPLTDEDVQEATRLVRSVLPHVSDCDGLSIMVERLPEEKVQSILDAREHSIREGLDLLRWAGEVRNRPTVAPE